MAEVIEEVGEKRVEEVLDVALALEPHIDTNQPLNRRRSLRDTPQATSKQRATQARGNSVTAMPAVAGRSRRIAPKPRGARSPLRIPPHPERDLLWFIASYAPEMEDWERDIFLAVRKEAYYFQPVFNCQIMNEGLGKLLALHDYCARPSFLPRAGLPVDCMKTHSDVVRPYGGDNRISLQVNPSCILANALSATRLRRGGGRGTRAGGDARGGRLRLRAQLPQRGAGPGAGAVRLLRPPGRPDPVADANLAELHETLRLAPKYNFGAPRVAAEALGRRWLAGAAARTSPMTAAAWTCERARRVAALYPPRVAAAGDAGDL
ncbi:MAG: SpoVR family protein [Arhodomonas sp.]|nr:SpoVR family protein [Arhodomonas sp.]